MMIPMWLTSIVLPLVIWVFTKVIPFAPIPTIVFDMWYCPFPIDPHGDKLCGGKRF